MLLRRIITHVKAQNWTAVALDFVIVVVGVFIGIQVANLNDARGERQLGDEEGVYSACVHERRRHLMLVDFDPNLVPVGAELHEKYCEKCHEQGGRHADSAPILAGQWIPYLRTSLKYVPTGEHLVPPLMEKTVADMGKDEINALMSFYASRQE